MLDSQKIGKEKDAVAIIVSDLHINSTPAICIPVINLDDGGTYHASRVQRALYEDWIAMWQELDDRYPRSSWRRLVFFNGDLGELDTKKRSIQLITLNKSTIQDMVFDTIEPALDWGDTIYFMRGTPAHTGKSAWLEEAIAKDISNVGRCTKKGAVSWWHIRACINDVRIDVAHHASASGTPWTRPNSVVRLASRTLWHYRVQRQQPAPHLVVRSHNHKELHIETEGLEARFTPAWTMLTENGYRMGFENDLTDIGALVAECKVGGELTTKSIRYRPKGENRIWALKI